MTTATVDPQKAPSPADRAALWMRLATIWHAILVVAGLVGAFLVWQGEDTAVWQKAIFGVLLLLMAVLSGTAVFYINQRRSRGRNLSLAVNYLGFLFTLVGSMHQLNMFIGLDSLADTFTRGLPFLALIFIGLWLGSQTDRFEGDLVRQQQVRQVGRAIAILAGIIFLFAVGLLDGLATIPTALIGGWETAVFLTATVLFGLMVWGMWQQPLADAFQATNADTEMLNGYLFLSPNLLGFLIFFAGPLILSLYVSFTDSDAFTAPNFIGLENYAEIFNLDFEPLANPNQLANEVLDTTRYDELNRFTIFGQSYIIGAEDRLFWTALGNTLQFVLLAVPLSVIPALFLANLLNSKVPGMRFFRAVYFLPSIAAVVGIALVWQWLYNATIGYINYGITLLIDLFNTIGLPLTDPQIRWLSESDTALLAVIIMAAWQWIGFNTVLFLAGLQNIPRSLYEAATVDGATPRQQFWKVTLPLLGPTTFFVVTTTVIQAMQVFEQVFIIMGNNPAGPSNSTLTIVLYLYQKGFQRFEQGYASAIAWVLFLLIFAATLVQFQRQRTSGSSYEG
ncbi:MAG: sugar ABC transporter permease [Anaerolineales bacterium]|nr:sugar ABC transporter permease [Anaerolineales bacterium]MCB8936994.1 sugar ABC transporter permease [Ardenticatenaceae bacterium]